MGVRSSPGSCASACRRILSQTIINFKVKSAGKKDKRKIEYRAIDIKKEKS
jgi:hypothetical protein